MTVFLLPMLKTIDLFAMNYLRTEKKDVQSGSIMGIWLSTIPIKREVIQMSIANEIILGAGIIAVAIIWAS